MPVKIRRIILSILIVLALCVWIEVGRADRAQCADCVKVHFLDVGQGDATLVEWGNNQQLLIDGGPDESVLYELGRYMPLMDRRIEYIVLTHPHNDHLVGLDKVLEQYSVGQIISADVDTGETNNQYWQGELRRLNIPVRLARAGQTIQLRDDIVFNILWPKTVPAGEVADSSINNLSVIGELIYQGQGVMLLGDAMAEVQNQICDTLPQNISMVAIKAAHHGGEGTISDCIINKSQPHEVVISVGADNRYGHPAQSTLDYFKQKNISVIRTDIAGTYTEVLGQ